MKTEFLNDFQFFLDISNNMKVDSEEQTNKKCSKFSSDCFA